MTMLDPILESTRARIARLPTVAELRARAADVPPPRPLVDALAGPGLAVIAEVKRRSPSRGELAPGLDPAEVASAYVRGGAAAISVLTEPDHFSGSDDDLGAVREAVAVPVLRKDFTLVEAQVWEARAIGADAVLLIVAALGQDELCGLVDAAHDAGVTPLVEVHDEAEAERALLAGARVVGVNNRDLTTFHVDLGTAERLAPVLAGADVRIAESGVSDPAHAARMAAAGYDAVLVGEHLVRAADPAALIGELRAAG